MFEKKAYAFKIKEKNKRLDSQSGGAFTAIAEIALENGYIVYGVSFEKPYAVYKRIDKLADLNSIKGSKYVQAYMNEVFYKIEKDINANKWVLFCGTPCYAYSVKKYVETKGLDNSRLLTIEFLCHGVPSPKAFSFFLKRLERQENCNVVNVNFRDKRINGWGGFYSSYFTNKGKIVSKNWLDFFHSDNFFRESCYNCQFTTYNRKSDITISDFWGIQNVAKKFGDINGVSMILFNTKFGYSFINGLQSKGEIIEVGLNAIDQSPLNHPICRPSNDNKNKNKNLYNDYNGLFSDVFKNYKEPNIRFCMGIPLSFNFSFQKEYWLSKVKGSIFLIKIKNKLEREH